MKQASGRALSSPPVAELIGASRELKSWVQRASRFVSADDARHLLPDGVWETVRAFLKSEERLAGWSERLEARDPEFVRVLVELGHFLGRHYFRTRFEGVENVPSEGPVLLVGNHNSTIMTTEVLLTVTAMWDHFGPDRAVRPLAHDIVWADPVGRRLCHQAGMLRANRESAAAALRAGHVVLVYPGSELDSCRTFRERSRVKLGGRTGFLRVALRERVPIVPVVSAGTHEQVVVLASGRRIARALNLKRYIRMEAFPIVWSLPWGISSGLMPFVPLPAQTTLRFGKPIRWPELASDAADNSKALARCYQEVESTMQGMLDELSRDRIPWFGKSERLLPLLRSLRGER